MRYFLFLIIVFVLLTNASFSQGLSFKKYPVTYVKNPEKHYSDLIKSTFSLTFSNKDSSLFMEYVSNSYTDPEDNRYEEIEDKLNLE
ncbi:MAG: hypothetical protein ABII25_00705, partial [bacterium]